MANPTETYLEGINFPAQKRDLVKYAKEKGADMEVMRMLKDLPERQYENAADVSSELGEGGGGGNTNM